MGYTKGKWTIEPTGIDGGDDKLIIGHPNPKDFQVIRTIGRLFSYGEPEEQAANARLIAAAPDLLETLETIKDQAERAAVVQDRSVGIIKQTCKVIAKEAAEAIAKAGE